MDGATVTSIVAADMVGEALHRLESEADVFLVSRTPDPARNREIWRLRSDRFPHDWEGGEVVMRGLSDVDGLQFVPVLRLPR